MFKDNSRMMMNSFDKVNKEVTALANKKVDNHFGVILKKKIEAIYKKYKFDIETITLKDDVSNKDITKRISTKFNYIEDGSLYTSSIKANSNVEAKILDAGFQGTAISVSDDILEFFLGKAPTDSDRKNKYIDPNGMKTVFTNAVKLELKK